MVLSILLLILKIIGIVLACIVGLVLLIVLLVLLVPFRYRISGKYSPEDYEAGAQFTWLLHFINVRAFFREMTLKLKARVTVIPIFKKTMSFGKESPKEDAPPDPAVLEPEMEPIDPGIGRTFNENADISEHIKSSPQPSEKPSSAPLNRSKDNVIWEMAPEYKDDDIEVYDVSGLFQPKDIKSIEEMLGNTDRSTEEEVSPPSFEKFNEPEEDENEAQKQSTEEKLLALVELIRKTLSGIYVKIDGVLIKAEEKADSIHAKADKIDLILSFLSSDSFRCAFRSSKSRVFKILRSICPKKPELHLHYGFDDPALTGKVLGVLSVIADRLPGEYEIEPEWLDKTLEGDMAIKGYIHLIQIAIPGLGIILNKDVRHCWKQWKRYKQEGK